MMGLSSEPEAFSLESEKGKRLGGGGKDDAYIKAILKAIMYLLIMKGA